MADGYIQGAVDFIFAPVPPDELRAKVSVFANLFIKAETLAARAREVQTSADQLRLLTERPRSGSSRPTPEQIRLHQPPLDRDHRYSAREAAGRPWDIIIGPQQHADLPPRWLRAPAAIELSRRFEIHAHGSPPGSCW